MIRARKLLIAYLAVIIALSLANANLIFAGTDDTQIAYIEGQKKAVVTINSGSSFKVTVPSTININQSSKAVLNETYTVKVEGDIGGEEKIKVVPNSTFSLNQDGKTSVEVTVNQSKTEFKYNEINTAEGCNTSGKLTTTDEITAGTWTGNLTFNINYVETLKPGLYETGTTNILKSWQELIDEGTITVSNGTVKSNYSSGTNSSSDALDGDLVLDNNVLYIGRFGFKDCTNLTSVVIGNRLDVIYAGAFAGCTSLTSVNIPESVTEICAEAFADCGNISDLVIPDSITTIWADAFYNVPHITYGGSLDGAPWGALDMN